MLLLKCEVEAIIRGATTLRNGKDPDGVYAGSALYVHWPFCKALCPYCDFNSHVQSDIDHARWRNALLAELDHMAATAEIHALASIFFGGGTPSLMQPETVAALIERARHHWPWQTPPEITLEANPTSVEAGKLRAFRDAGVDRVSLGVQSLDDDALRFLGRKHTASEARAAVETALDLFERVSLDLIYGRAGQTREDWLAELDRALALGTRHISLYQLTIEPGTLFHARMQAGRLPLLAPDTQAMLLAATRDHLEARGFQAYEVSNHAHPGEECRHNLVYWRYGDYLGIGPGAHGRIGGPGKAMRHPNGSWAPAAWLDAVETQGHAELPREVVTPSEAATEALMMGLRLEEGVPLRRIASWADLPLVEWLDLDQVKRAVAGGSPRARTHHICARPTSGRMVLDTLLARILA